MIFSRYRVLFAVPELRRTVAFSIAGRMPIGIAGLAILLFVQARSGSFTFAGTTSALYVLGLGVVAPFLGRLIDRLGPTPVLTICAVLYPAALVGLTALVLNSASTAGIYASAMLAGATLPPISACIRAMYPRLLKDASLLHTAYSVDSALVEAVFILGPALVAGALGACAIAAAAEPRTAQASKIFFIGNSLVGGKHRLPPRGMSTRQKRSSMPRTTLTPSE